MSVCTCIAQDRAHLTQVLPCRPIVHCPSEHWLQLGAPLWGVTLLIGKFSWRQSGRRQWLKPYAYSYRTQEAPGQRQRLRPYMYSYQTDTVSSSQTAAQREEGLAAERLRHIPLFISSSYYTFPYTLSAYWTYTLFAYPIFITHLSHS